MVGWLQAGNFTRENVATDLIYLIARTKELYAFSVHKLFAVLKKNKVNQVCAGSVGGLVAEWRLRALGLELVGW